MKKQTILILIFALLFAQTAYSELTATVDRTEVMIGETFNLVIKMDKNSNSQPDLTELSQSFRVLSNSSSMSTQIINNQYSFEKSWNLVLMPLKEGVFEIPPIEIDGEKTQRLNIQVKAPDPNAKAEGDIFIEVTTDKISAFVKEQIIFKVKLFYSMSLSEGSLSDPYASDTLISMLDKNSNYSTVRDGKRYEVIERHYALFAEKSGTMEVNPIIFNGRDNTSRRSMSMFSTGKPVRAVSQPVSIEIKPIPQQAIGKDWLPATSLRLAEKWSNPPYTVGEPITRTITMFVEGLSETQIPDIDLGEIEYIKTYPEQPQTQTEITPRTIKAVKQIKVALIPTQDGTLRIPEYSLEWYNTETGEFEMAQLPPRTLDIKPGAFSPPPIDLKQQLDAMTSSASQTQSEEKTEDQKSADEIQAVDNYSDSNSWIWQLSTAIFALLWVLTLLYKRQPKMVEKSKPQVNNNLISNKDVLAAINAHDTNLLQRNFIDWWNSKHPDHSASNLSQISLWLDNDNSSLLSQLQECIYNNSKKEFDFQLFKSAFNSGKLNPQKAQTSSPKEMELPQLYH